MFYFDRWAWKVTVCKVLWPKDFKGKISRDFMLEITPQLFFMNRVFLFVFIIFYSCSLSVWLSDFALALLSREAPFLERIADFVRSRKAVTRKMAAWRECGVIEFHSNRKMQVKVHAYFGWVVLDFGWEILSLVETLTTEPAHIPRYCSTFSFKTQLYMSQDR